jgi:hypothetical protein
VRVDPFESKTFIKEITFHDFIFQDLRRLPGDIMYTGQLNATAVQPDHGQSVLGSDHRCVRVGLGNGQRSQLLLRVLFGSQLRREVSVHVAF